MGSWRVMATASCAAALLACGPVRAESSIAGAAGRIDDPVLASCLERTLPARGLRQRVDLQVFDDTGSAAVSEASVYWQRTEGQRSRFLVRLDAPPLRAGIAVLAVERDRPEPDMYLYLPDLRQTRRVTGRTFSGSMLGTDFSYEDYAQVQGLLKNGELRRLPDERFGDRDVLVVELVPQSKRSAYARVVSSIDSERCVPLLTRFIGRDGTILKELSVDLDSIEAIGDRHVARRLVMRDLVQDTRTELEVTDIELDPPLSDSLFAPSSLGGH